MRTASGIAQDTQTRQFSKGQKLTWLGIAMQCIKRKESRSVHRLINAKKNGYDLRRSR
ncbi:MAG: hypothetical protein K2Q19_06350 [Rhodocyclaceae bacterium]|nr:hypothetical protein [Rhodocyclaceae bacterium]